VPSRSRRLAACLALVVGAGALSSIAPVAAAPDDQAFAPLRGFEPSGAKVRVEPKDYAAFTEFCRRVDETEAREMFVSLK